MVNESCALCGMIFLFFLKYDERNWEEWACVVGIGLQLGSGSETILTNPTDLVHN